MAAHQLPMVAKWAAQPAEWNGAAALLDPLSWLDLAPWPLTVDELRRGAQIGPANPRRVWACGFARYPHHFARGIVHASPLALILPSAWRALIEAGPEPSRIAGEAVARPLVVRGLMLHGRNKAGGPCVRRDRLPGAHGAQIAVYALRAELSLLDDAALAREHPAVRALALMMRPRFAPWFDLHAPAELIERPDLAVHCTPRRVGRRRPRRASKVEGPPSQAGLF